MPWLGRRGRIPDMYEDLTRFLSIETELRSRAQIKQRCFCSLADPKAGLKRKRQITYSLD